MRAGVHEAVQDILIELDETERWLREQGPKSHHLTSKGHVPPGIKCERCDFDKRADRLADLRAKLAGALRDGTS